MESTIVKVQDFVIVACPEHVDGETFARGLGGQWFCNGCGATDHAVVTP